MGRGLEQETPQTPSVPIHPDVSPIRPERRAGAAIRIPGDERVPSLPSRPIRDPLQADRLEIGHGNMDGRLRIGLRRPDRCRDPVGTDRPLPPGRQSDNLMRRENREHMAARLHLVIPLPLAGVQLRGSQITFIRSVRLACGRGSTVAWIPDPGQWRTRQPASRKDGAGKIPDSGIHDTTPDVPWRACRFGARR